MHKVSAARDKDAFVPQRSESIAEFEMEGRRLRLVNAELDNRDRGVVIDMAKHGPRPVIQPIPFVIESNVLRALRIHRTNQRFHIGSRFDALLDSAHSIVPIWSKIAGNAGINGPIGNGNVYIKRFI